MLDLKTTNRWTVQALSCFSLWMLLSVEGRQPWLPPEKDQVPGRGKTNAPTGKIYTGSDGHGIRVHNGDHLTSIY